MGNVKPDRVNGIQNTIEFTRIQVQRIVSMYRYKSRGNELKDIIP